MKIKGLETVQNNLKKLERNAKNISGENQVPLDELFSYEFMHKNTNFDYISEFFKSAGVEVKSQDDFEKLEKEILDNAVSRFTKFNSWSEMISDAGKEYVERELFKGIK